VRNMNRFEKARILGARALQLAMNAPVLVKIKGREDVLEVARKELAKDKIPITVVK